MKLRQNISNQINNSEQLSPVLEKLKQEGNGYSVPDGYFDSLSSRIVDEIKIQENRSLLKSVVPFRKPMIWAPALVTVIVAVLLIFVVPGKKESTIPVVDEWTQINMAYDASYAEEAILAESNTIDKALENKDVSYIASASYNGENEPTIDEITEYLKEQEIDTDILNEY